ncbi:uncharacterized protein LOC118278972 isoform X3 [Spodoptera frugiperda]|uniref:Uncharacterized protein LOC118278972 isoform X3 n=1 Tax=Spodoptera frugiperda TaxID=7108 RepID=A0A9R0DIU5_SPOFR|nr:uncharacterized protein LOC118278972 isoform X3 [Spodoptera frugiperda]
MMQVYSLFGCSVNLAVFEEMLPGCSKDFPQLPGCSKDFPQLPGCSKDFPQLPGCSKDFPQLPGCSKDFPQLPGCSKDFPQLPGCSKDFPQLPGCSKDFPQLPGCSKDFPQLPGCSNDFPQLPGCSNDFPQLPGTYEPFRIPPAEELIMEREKMRKLKLELQSFDCPEIEPRCDLDAELREVGLIEVQGPLWPAQHPIQTARELWSTMSPYLVLRGVSLDKLPNRLPKLTIALTTDTGDRIIPPADFGWSDSEMLGACVVTLVATIARESHIKRVAARTLQTLLDYHATHLQLENFLDMILKSFPDPRMRRDISDMVINGVQRGADRVARALCYTTLLTIIHKANPNAGIAINKYKVGECSKSLNDQNPIKNENGETSAIQVNVIKFGGKSEPCDTQGSPGGASALPVEEEDVKVSVTDVVEGDAYPMLRVAEAIPFWRHCTDAERYEVIKLAGRLMADSMSEDITEAKLKARRLLLKNIKQTKTQNATPYHQYKERVEIGKLDILFNDKY